MSDPYVLVSSAAPQDATTTLFFGNVVDRTSIQIGLQSSDAGWRELFSANAHARLRALAGASAVIVVRDLFNFARAPNYEAVQSVPRYYFLDDNFFVLRDAPGLLDPALFADFSLDRVREALSGYAGVLLATPSLVEYFREHRLHGRLTLFPPVVHSAVPLRQHRDGALTIGFFGGMHRREPFLAHVYPAIRRLAQQQPIRLVVAGIDRHDLPDGGGLAIEVVGYNRSYTEGLRAMSSYGIDVLTHPGSVHSNNAYKNTHVLINAHVLGAVPVFSDGPPYDTIADAGVALICENTESAWLAALGRVAADAGLRDAVRARLGDYCATHFSGRSNVNVISTILHEHRRPAAGQRMVRQLRSLALQGVSVGQRLVTRAMRVA